MRRSTTRAPHSDKRKLIGKKSREARPKKARPTDEDAQQEDEDYIEEEEQEVEATEDPALLETAEQKRLRLAKQILQSARSKNNITTDDFFLQEGEVNEEQHQAVNDYLRQEYLKKTNALYSPFGARLSKLKFGEPVVYRGHTQCITAVQTSPIDSNIFFSCSKDGSLIKWDRATGKKTFLTMGKQDKHEMLCMAINGNGTILATGSSDATVQLWDVERDCLITTLKSHKNEITGLKFGLNSNDKLISVSADRTIKMWDAVERTYIDTFYGHREDGLDIDCINTNDFITSGKDLQVIVWKTEKQTQTVFAGHDYAIDRVRVVNTETFLTASQDGGVFLWSTRKKKPIFKHQAAHSGSWISSLTVLPNTDLFASGAGDHHINIYQLAEDLKSFSIIQRLPTDGITTDIKLRDNMLLAVCSDEHRLGRWVTDKCRNHIKIFPYQL